jgi:hypothetical protein
MKKLRIEYVTVHPQTAEARRAVAPLIKHLTELSTAQLLELSRRAQKVQRKNAIGLGKFRTARRNK